MHSSVDVELTCDRNLIHKGKIPKGPHATHTLCRFGLVGGWGMGASDPFAQPGSSHPHAADTPGSPGTLAGRATPPKAKSCDSAGWHKRAREPGSRQNDAADSAAALRKAVHESSQDYDHTASQARIMD